MRRAGRHALLAAGLLFGVSAFAAVERRPASASPIYGVTLPDGYRNWTLVSVAQE